MKGHPCEFTFPFFLYVILGCAYEIHQLSTLEAI